MTDEENKKKINPGDVYRKIQYAENIFKRGMTLAVFMLTVSILFYCILAYLDSYLIATILLSVGSVFGIMSFIQHYLGYRIIQRIKRQGRITDKDMKDVMRLKWGPF